LLLKLKAGEGGIFVEQLEKVAWGLHKASVYFHVGIVGIHSFAIRVHSCSSGFFPDLFHDIVIGQHPC
jgi:hypothetical protein